MWHNILATAVLLLLAFRCVSAADMFVSITPGPGPLAPVYNATSSTLAPTTLATTHSIQSPESLSSVVDGLAECTLGLTNDCLPLYTTAPRSAADPSALAMAHGVENLLWIIAFGGALLLLSTGKVEAVLLLILLIVAKAKGQDEASPTSNSFETPMAPTVNTSSSERTSVTTGTPHATMTLMEKLQCYQTVNGLAYPSPCMTVYVWTPVPSRPDPTDAPGPVCQANGLEIPCADVGHGAASSARRVADMVGWTASTQACMVAVLFVDRLWARPIVALCLAVAVNGEEVLATSIPTTTALTATSSAGLPQTTTLAPNVTVPEDKVYCYVTSSGLAFPSPCPGDFNPTVPSPALQPGQCMRNGLEYQCGATYEQSSAACTITTSDGVLGSLWLPLVAWRLGFLDKKMLALAWLIAAMEIRVLASPSVSTAPPVTSTVTVYRATPPPALASITATVTTLQALPARRENDVCPTVYGMQSCPLPYIPVDSAGSASFAWPLAFGTAITGLAMSRLVSTGTLYAFWPILAAAAQADAQVIAGLTSVPLPELAINTTTTPAVTVTQMVFVANANAHFTPTITEYIALCTPYCAHVNDKGQCDKVQGCKNAATSDSEEAFIARVTDYGIAMGVALLAGVAAGRMRWLP
ncbi:hypothetical protein B0A55_11534 [Friedmanniomyces simplex]|uniref:Uncharacterized protein n=1 Tax=Friedmanniomyces simplex TaxID=329884 RepID=A0A4U0WEZ9_9PEZI|nr:hypothetical protein B0A55_11534 [Friedmanniomyces simplex]